MEKQGIDNKLLKDLGAGLIDLSELLGSSIDVAEQAIKENMSEKEKVRFEAFQTKFIKLTVNGKHKEAQELKKKYSEQF